MLLDELSHLIDRLNTVQIAFALRRAPGEKTMAPENQAFDGGIFFHRALDEKTEFKPGPLPGNPRDLASEFPVELLQLTFAVCARRQRNRPVRMQVIDVREGKKSMQRSVD